MNTWLKFNNNVELNGMKVKRTEVSSSSYNVLLTDYIIAITYTTIGIVSIILPSITSVPLQIFKIVDEGGNASVNNITITC